MNVKSRALLTMFGMASGLAAMPQAEETAIPRRKMRRWRERGICGINSWENFSKKLPENSSGK